jgi:2-succinyl-6-hydroxy-2,4-cyclohexadiene-1-carboxylate synthase
VTIVFVQGFTQTASAWSSVLSGTTGLEDTIVFGDLPIAENFEATALAIGELGGAGVYVGYSMGGRLCLRLALDRPDLVHALVLVSTSPGLRTAAERAERVAADAALAAGIEQDGIDAFLARWLAQPMFASIPPGRSGIADRRRLAPEYLTASLRVLGTGAMEPVWDRLPELAMPVLVVTGTEDAKFDAIGREMAAAVGPNAEVARLGGGHALLLERPDELRDLVVAFAHRHG